MHRKDLTGIIFGKLTVVKYLYTNKHRKPIWLCKCECGNFAEVKSMSLIGGSTRSCGCLHKEVLSKLNLVDLAGKRFGRLVAIERSIKSGERGEIMWECICDCGRATTVLGRSLRDLRTISCGCYRSEMAAEKHTTHGLSKTKEYIQSKGNRRREKKLLYDCDWTTEMEMYLTLFFSECVICGSKNKLATDHVRPLIDNNGLKPGNAIRLCHSCNSRKGRRSPEDLPKTLPKDAGDKILKAAQDFKEYWESWKIGTKVLLVKSEKLC